VTARPDPRVGTDLGPYRIEALIGRGGMGVVYLATHTGLDRKVALKLLAPDYADDDAFRARFLRESRMAAAIDHPNIIPIYEAGEVDGTYFLAMRYVAGTDLETRLRAGPLEPREAVHLLGAVASALDAAHEQGLIHRDVKPANVLIAAGRGVERVDHAYLTDFGLTKHRGSQSGLTQGGAFMGTLTYIAPEQIEGKPVDGRTDEYGLACVAFECLTGRVPFARDTDIAIAMAHLRDSPPSAAELRPELPPAVDAVLARGMAKRPDDRFPSCESFVVALRGALGVRPTEERPAVAGSLEAQAAPAPLVRTGPPVALDPIMAHGLARDSVERHPSAAIGTPTPRRGVAVGIVAGSAVLLLAVVAYAGLAGRPSESPAPSRAAAAASLPPGSESSGASPVASAPAAGSTTASAPAASPSPVPFPNAVEAAILAALPSTLAQPCVRGGTPDDARLAGFVGSFYYDGTYAAPYMTKGPSHVPVAPTQLQAGLMCRPATGAARLYVLEPGWPIGWIVGYKTQIALGDTYIGFLEVHWQIPVGSCATDKLAYEAWTGPGGNGTLACMNPYDGRPWIYFTFGKGRYLGFATRDDSDYAALYRWWEQLKVFLP
jgi:hypothetical protein